MAIATLEVARSFKRKDPESYHRLVKKLYCETMGIEFKDEIFMYEENARKDSTGCLSVIMHQKLLEGREEAGISYLLLRVRETMSIIPPKKTKKNIFFLLSLEHPYQASFKLFFTLAHFKSKIGP